MVADSVERFWVGMCRWDCETLTLNQTKFEGPQ